MIWKQSDSVNRFILWDIMCKRGCPKRLVDAVNSLYCRARTVLSIGEDLTEETDINQGVRQGCTMSHNIV